MKYGVPAANLVFSNPVKEEKDIFFAKFKGV